MKSGLAMQDYLTPSYPLSPLYVPLMILQLCETVAQNPAVLAS